MSWYSRWLLPRLLDLTMRRKLLLPYRRRAIAGAERMVLEVGVGSGLNLTLYRDVDCIYGIDPSPRLLAYARERIKRVSRPVFLARASAEALPFKDGSFHTVVMTWTLCSIPDPLEALREMRRVLKRDGRLLFVEHGLAPELGVRWWQHRLTPLWAPISGGRHLYRKMDDLIRAAGFDIQELQTGYLKGPKPMTFIYEGRATPACE